MKTLTICLTAAVLAVSGCASTSRLLSYGGNLSDATVNLGPAAFQIYVHPQDDTLLIQRAMSQVAATDSEAMALIVAERFIEPTPCELGKASGIASGSWEVVYSCPANFDLRNVILSQRDSLRAGNPIQP